MEMDDSIQTKLGLLAMHGVQLPLTQKISDAFFQ